MNQPEDPWLWSDFITAAPECDCGSPNCKLVMDDCAKCGSRHLMIEVQRSQPVVYFVCQECNVIVTSFRLDASVSKRNLQ